MLLSRKLLEQCFIINVTYQYVIYNTHSGTEDAVRGTYDGNAATSREKKPFAYW
jgi:hypothetical protein